MYLSGVDFVCLLVVVDCLLVLFYMMVCFCCHEVEFGVVIIEVQCLVSIIEGVVVVVSC